MDNARGRLLTLGAGLFAAGALVFTARNFTLSREGQVTDRYTKAIEQLGSDKLDVRIGGIYALERVARDSARDHPTVMEVLTAFIREHSREQWPPPVPSRSGNDRHGPTFKPPSPWSGAGIRTRHPRSTQTSPARTSPARTSPARTSATRTSPARTSPARASTCGPHRRDPHRRGPHRRALIGADLTARTSTARTSPARTSPTRTSPADLTAPVARDMRQFRRAGN